MKNIKFLLILLLTSPLFVACDTDGGTSELDLIEGAVVDFTKDPSAAAILDLNSLNAGDDIQVSFEVDQESGDIESVDVIAFYESGENVYGPVELQSNITEFPTTITLSDSDIIAAFSELNGKGDFQLADELIITSRIHLTDGRILETLDENGTRLYGSDLLAASYVSLVMSYPVSCPSDLGGTYNVVSSGVSTDGGATNNPIVDYPYTVTVTDNGGGSYSISDGVAGVYIQWYTVYGYTFETAGKFTDICGVLSGSWTEGFGATVELDGTVNEDGTLSIHWINSFGDEATAVYTPQ